jgi:hypothetical protein
MKSVTINQQTVEFDYISLVLFFVYKAPGRSLMCTYAETDAGDVWLRAPTLPTRYDVPSQVSEIFLCEPPYAST